MCEQFFSFCTRSRPPVNKSQTCFISMLDAHIVTSWYTISFILITCSVIQLCHRSNGRCCLQFLIPGSLFYYSFQLIFLTDSFNELIFQCLCNRHSTNHLMMMICQLLCSFVACRLAGHYCHSSCNSCYVCFLAEWQGARYARRKNKEII